MRKLHIGIIDVVSRGPTRALYARVMNPNLASIMPQVIGVWCREQGHDVSFICYTGLEDLLTDLPSKVDLVFIGAFTESAHTAYALSNLLRFARGHHGNWGTACPLLPGRCPAVFRLRPGLYRQGDHPRRSAGMLPASAGWDSNRSQAAAENTPRGPRAMAVYRTHAQNGTPHQNRSHARQPGVSLYL